MSTFKKPSAHWYFGAPDVYLQEVGRQAFEKHFVKKLHILNPKLQFQNSAHKFHRDIELRCNCNMYVTF